MKAKTKTDSILTLLEDPNDDVFNEIKHFILENIDEYHKSISDIYELYPEDSILRKRTEQILSEAILNKFNNDLLNYTKKIEPEPSLIDGIILIESYINEYFDADKFKKYLKKISTKIWLKCNDKTCFEIPKIIKDTLSEEKIFIYNNLNGIKSKFSFFDFDIYRNGDKYINELQYQVLYLTVCQELNISMYPSLIPAINSKIEEKKIAYVDHHIVKLSNIPSKNGILYTLDEKMDIDTKKIAYIGTVKSRISLLLEYYCNRFIFIHYTTRSLKRRNIIAYNSIQFSMSLFKFMNKQS